MKTKRSQLLKSGAKQARFWQGAAEFLLSVSVQLVSEGFEIELGCLARILTFRSTRDSESPTGVKNPCLIAKAIAQED